MRSISRGLAALLLLAAFALTGTAATPPPVAAAASASSASDGGTTPPPEVTVPALRARLDKIPAAVDTDDDVAGLVAQTQDIVAQAQRFVASRAGPLADLNARLGELGTAPPKGTAEDADITRQRTALEKERNGLDADIRLARLVAVDAQQRGSDLLAQRRALFEAHLLERSNSPLAGAFWRDIRSAWPTDRDRLVALEKEVRTGVSTALHSAARGSVIASLVGALLLALLGSWAAEHALTRLAARHFPMGRLRRSLLAVAMVTATVLIVALAAQWGWQTLEDAGQWGPTAQRLGESVANFAIFVGFVIGLGRALLANGRPSWRLPPMADAMAARMAPYPWLIAGVTTLIWLTTQINTLVDASLAATVATHVATALALTALTVVMLMRLRLPDADVAPAVAAAPAPESLKPEDAAALAGRPLWVGLVTGAVAVVLIAICVLAAFGYVSLASFLASQLTWTGVVGAAAYLLFKFTDDLFIALLSSRSNAGQRLQKSLNVAPQTLDQAAIVLSAVGRVALFFYLVIALLAPLGTSPSELFQRSGKVGSSLKVGQFELVPGALFGALAVLVIGFLVLRLFKRWLDNSYLPSTTLEPGMRSSLTTLLGYVGGILVIASALSALGIGIERIAWVASALSVGIGFGLQAIVQNFISGLILLTERPVKVGDLISISGVEGDIRRINVRATEIQLSDKSTVIVPNSQLISQNVRNATMGNAQGVATIVLTFPLDIDPEQVRTLLLDAYNLHESILENPPPSVSFKELGPTGIVLSVTGYVNSPRMVGGTRSDLLYEILKMLRAAEISLSQTQTMVLEQPLAKIAAAEDES